jgi:hypothetical protein
MSRREQPPLEKQEEVSVRGSYTENPNPSLVEEESLLQSTMGRNLDTQARRSHKPSSGKWPEMNVSHRY